MPKVQEILRLLSNDIWTINLHQQSGECETPSSGSPGPGKVLLFSGGLDSLAAAVEYLKRKSALGTYQSYHQESADHDSAELAEGYADRFRSKSCTPFFLCFLKRYRNIHTQTPKTAKELALPYFSP